MKDELFIKILEKCNLDVKKAADSYTIHLLNLFYPYGQDNADSYCKEIYDKYTALKNQGDLLAYLIETVDKNNPDEYWKTHQKDFIDLLNHLSPASLPKNWQDATMKSAITANENDLYHCFYELIQNADDAEADKITISADGDDIIVSNNGKSMNFYEIKALCDINSSSKKNDADTIGEKGRGFKTVFMLTNEVEVHSGGYHFGMRINENKYEITKPSDNSDQANGTIIRLKNVRIADALEGLKKKYGLLGENDTNAVRNCPILFLKNVKTLEIEENSITVSDNEIIHTVGKTEHRIPIIKRSYKGGFSEDEIKSYPNQTAGEYTIDIIAPIGLKEKVMGRLFVYLPTETDLCVPVLVNMPAYLNDSREQLGKINNKHIAWNKKLLQDLLSAHLKAFYEEICSHSDIDIYDMLPENDHFLSYKDQPYENSIFADKNYFSVFYDNESFNFRKYFADNYSVFKKVSEIGSGNYCTATQSTLPNSGIIYRAAECDCCNDLYKKYHYYFYVHYTCSKQLICYPKNDDNDFLKTYIDRFDKDKEKRTVALNSFLNTTERRKAVSELFLCKEYNNAKNYFDIEMLNIYPVKCNSGIDYAAIKDKILLKGEFKVPFEYTELANCHFLVAADNFDKVKAEENERALFKDGCSAADVRNIIRFMKENDISDKSSVLEYVKWLMTERSEESHWKKYVTDLAELCFSAASGNSIDIEYETFSVYAYSKLKPKKESCLPLPDFSLWDKEYCEALCVLSDKHVCELKNELQGEPLLDEKFESNLKSLADEVEIIVYNYLQTDFVHFYTKSGDGKKLYILFKANDEKLKINCLNSLMKGLGLLQSLQAKEATILTKAEAISVFEYVERDLNTIKQLAYLYQYMDAVRSTRHNLPDNHIAYELIQNANDAKRKTDDDNGLYNVVCTNNTITLEYTEKGFSLADVFAISIKGVSGNRETFNAGTNKETTGHKGTGFTSLYNLFEKVEVSSGAVKITLDNVMMQEGVITNEGVIFNKTKPKAEIPNMENSLPIPIFEPITNEGKTTVVLTPKSGADIGCFNENIHNPDNYLFMEKLHEFKYNGKNTVGEYIDDTFYRYDLTLPEDVFNELQNCEDFKSRVNSDRKRTITVLFPKNLNDFENKKKVYCDLPLDSLSSSINFIINIPMLELEDNRKNYVKGDHIGGQWNKSVMGIAGGAFKELFNKFAEEHADIAYRYFPYNYKDLLADIVFLKTIQGNLISINTCTQLFLEEYVYYWRHEFDLAEAEAVLKSKGESNSFIYYGGKEGEEPIEVWIVKKIGTYLRNSALSKECVSEWYFKQEIISVDEEDKLTIKNEKAVEFYYKQKLKENGLSSAILLGNLVEKNPFMLHDSLPLRLNYNGEDYYCVDSIFKQLNEVKPKSYAHNKIKDNIYVDENMVKAVFKWLEGKNIDKELGEALNGISCPEKYYENFTVTRNINGSYKISNELLFVSTSSNPSVISNAAISDDAKEILTTGYKERFEFSGLTIEPKFFSQFAKGEEPFNRLDNVNDRMELIKTLMGINYEWVTKAIEFVKAKSDLQKTVFELIIAAKKDVVIKWCADMVPLVEAYNNQFKYGGEPCVRFSFDKTTTKPIDDFHKLRFNDRTSDEEKNRILDIYKLTLSEIINSSKGIIRKDENLKLGNKYIFAVSENDTYILFSKDEGFDRIMKDLFGCNNFSKCKPFRLMESNRMLLRPKEDWSENGVITDEIRKNDTVINELRADNMWVLFDSFQAENERKEWRGYGADVHNGERSPKCPICQSNLLLSGDSVRLRQINANIGGKYIPLPFIMCSNCDNMFKIAGKASLISPCSEDKRLHETCMFPQKEDPITICEAEHSSEEKMCYHYTNAEDIMRNPEITIRLELKNSEDDEYNGYFLAKLTMQHRLILLNLIEKDDNSQS